MKRVIQTLSATALTISLAAAMSSAALAKAHDQGVGDGDRIPGTSQAGGTGVGGQGGVSAVVKSGARGDGASAAGSENSGDHGLGAGGVTPEH